MLSKPVPIKIMKDLMTKMQYVEIFLIPEKKKAISEVNNLEQIMANGYFTTVHDWKFIKL